MRRSGRPGRRNEVGLEQTMQMDDEIARLRAVDRLLGLGAPGALGARVIGKEADNVELAGITKFVASERFQLAAEHQVQTLRLCLVFGLRIRRGHGSHFLEDARSGAARRAGPLPSRRRKRKRPKIAAGQLAGVAVAARKPLRSRGAAASDAARSAP